MEETSTLRKYVRNKKIFIPAFIGMILLFFTLIGITGNMLFAFAVNEMAGYLIDNDSFGDAEFTIEDDEWEGEGTLEVTVSPGAFDEEEWENENPPVEFALTTPEGEVKKDEAFFEEVARMAEAELAQVEQAEAQAALDAAADTGAVRQDVTGAEAREAEEEEDSIIGRMHVYTATYLRDPFYSLIDADREIPNKLLDISRARMVGSVWGEKSIIGLLEDDAGRSYALKTGDKVVNGKVVSVSPAAITFSVTVFGLTKNVTLELAEEG